MRCDQPSVCGYHVATRRQRTQRVVTRRFRTAPEYVCKWLHVRHRLARLRSKYVQSIFLGLGSSETSVLSAPRAQIRPSAEATEESLVRGFTRISTEFMIRELISTALTKAPVSGHLRASARSVRRLPLSVFIPSLFVCGTLSSRPTAQ